LFGFFFAQREAENHKFPHIFKKSNNKAENSVEGRDKRSINSDDGREEEFARFYGWYKILLDISDDDLLKSVEIENMNCQRVLTFIQYNILKQKNTKK
jgi:hypothetical protein